MWLFYIYLYMTHQIGLDLSTTVCGWAHVCIENKTKTLLDAGFIDISKQTTYDDKSKLIINTIKSKNFDRIVVEEALSGFAFGQSRQQVILKLVKNKAVICYILEKEFKVPMLYSNAMTMRKQLFGKARVAGIPPKEYVKDKIEKMFDVSKYVVLNKAGNSDRKMEDLYDAIVAACYTI